MEPYYIIENSDGTSKVINAGEEIASYESNAGLMNNVKILTNKQ